MIKYPEVHLTGSSQARRDSRAARGFKLCETWWDSKELIMDGPNSERLLNWLNVEQSERYQREPSKTFCNIYAYDYCCQAGVYLPHVWWTWLAMNEIRKGENIIPKYGVNIAELNANGLYNWLDSYSNMYHWKKVMEVPDAQEIVNKGHVGVVCGKGHIGHISVIIPEWENRKCTIDKFGNKILLQSQAGWENKKTFSEDWYSQFKEYGFWVNIKE